MLDFHEISSYIFLSLYHSFDFFLYHYTISLIELVYNVI